MPKNLFLFSVLSLVLLSTLFSPAAAQAYVFSNQLDIGDRGEDVSALQQTLTSLQHFSYPTITGYFGPVTQTAVQAFQAARGIVSAGTPESTGFGRVGPQTLAELNAVQGNGPAATLNALIQQLKVLKARLAELRGEDIETATNPDLGTAANLKATERSNKATLTWDEVSGATSYLLKRKEYEGFYQTLATTTGTKYRDDDVSRTTRYYYTVTAVNDDGQGAASETAYVYIPGSGGGGGPDTSAPGLPTGLSVTAGDATSTVSWNDPGDGDLDFISIYRGTTSGSLALIATVNAGVETYSDSPLTNDTTYYYALSATDTTGNTSATTSEVSATPTGVYDIYVDSVNGDDSNDGTSDFEAFATLGAAETAAAAKGDGVKIGLKRGSSWREKLDLSSIDNITIKAYGSSGDILNISAGEVFDQTWLTATDRGDGNDNTYSYNWTHEGGVHISLLENGVRLKEIHTSIADVDATPGSYMANPDNTGDTETVVYVHPTGSSNPNSNGKTYDLAKRAFAVSLGDNPTAEGLHTTLNMGNNGSYTVKQGGSHNRILASHGTKHNAFAHGDETWTDSIFAETYQGSSAGSASLFVDFDSTLVGRSVEFNRVGFVWDRDLKQTNAVNTYTSHAGDSSEMDSIKYDSSWVIDLNKGFVATQINSYSVLNSYVQAISPFDQGDSTTDIVRTMVRQENDKISPFSPGASMFNEFTFTDNAIYASTSNSEFLTLVSGNNDIKLTQNAWVTDGQRGFLRDNGVDGGTFGFNKNIIWGSTKLTRRHIIATSSQTFTADHNVYYDPGANDLRGVHDGNEYRTLSAWQTATGQDANSVYLTDAQADNFWLGEPSDGDFRINPDAQVTASDGTVYTGEFPDGTSITEAGPQNHWDWNDRQAKSGAPTAWPNVPDTLEESKEYVLDPEDWTF